MILVSEVLGGRGYFAWFLNLEEFQFTDLFYNATEKRTQVM